MTRAGNSGGGAVADRVTTLAELTAIYGAPVEAATVKERLQLTPLYRELIAASPFAVLATSGPGGLDCSPRGDRPGFVRILDDRTLALPDRRGNNRVDSLRNIVSDPRVALLFLIPGSGTTFRVNGRATISRAAGLCASFAAGGSAPRTVIVIDIDAAYFQCARAVVRAGLWSAAAQVEAAALPSPGAMLAEASDNRVGGADYDRDWPARAAASLW